MNKKISGIYIIKNVINKKLYIGQSLDIKTRWSKHKSDFIKNRRENIYFINGLNKYGIENFKFKILILLPPNKKLLNLFEKFFIWLFNSKIPNGYNAGEGGNSTSGWIPTSEQIENMKQGRLKNKKYKDIKIKIKTKYKNAGYSKYLGVTYSKRFKKWRALISENKKQILIGSFDTEIEAANAYDLKSWQIYHDIRNLNFPNNFMLIYD